MRVRVRNMDGTATRSIPEAAAAQVQRLRYLEAVEGWDEINAGSGWVYLEYQRVEAANCRPLRRTTKGVPR